MRRIVVDGLKVHLYGGESGYMSKVEAAESADRFLHLRSTAELRAMVPRSPGVASARARE